MAATSQAILTTSATRAGVVALQTWHALGGEGRGERLCWEHTAIPFSDVLARGALAGLVKVAPEQIISTSNLNILKSRNNIESCCSYCKVLLRFFKQSQKQAGNHVNYLFTCVKPRNLAHG